MQPLAELKPQLFVSFCEGFHISGLVGLDFQFLSENLLHCFLVNLKLIGYLPDVWGSPPSGP